MGIYWSTFRKKYLTFVILSLVISGCTKKDMRIKALIPFDESASTLDPANLQLADRYILMDNMVAKLVHINSRGDYEWMLANSFEVSDDGKIVKIQLNRAEFSDGSSIKAVDVASSLKRLVILGSAHIPFKDFLFDAENLQNIDQDFEGITVISEYQLQLKLKRKTKELLYYFSLADSGVIHKSLLKTYPIKVEDWKVVSGAYLPKTNKRLEANPYFRWSDNKAPREVEIIPAPQSGNSSLMNGIDIGTTEFLPKDSSKALVPHGYDVINPSYNTLCYLVLNPSSEKFSDIRVRQKIASSIHAKLSIPTNGKFFKKANQFFLPDSFAFQKKFNPTSAIGINEANITLPPEITVLSTVGTRKFTFNELDLALSKAIESNVKLAFEDKAPEFYERKKLKNFDAYLVPTSMTYSVLTEALNILYMAPTQFGTNPNGKIKKLIHRYQEGIGDEESTISSIVNEMSAEAEIIPLFYVSTPDFYNTETIDVSEMNTTESLTFWKIRVK